MRVFQRRLFQPLILSTALACGAAAGPAAAQETPQDAPVTTVPLVQPPLHVVPAPLDPALPEPVARLLQTAGIASSAIGIVVMRGEQTLLSHQADQIMQPASTMKLVTSMVALDQLGPIFRGRTELRTHADLIDGTLKGDLILRGGADADLTADALEHMLEKLRNQGIRRIAGNLIIDRQLFQPARPDLGVAPFDDTPEFRYNVIPDAALLNMNLVDLDLRASGTGLKIILQPALEDVAVSSDMTLINANCAAWEDGWKPPTTTRSAGGKLTVVLHGTFPKNCNTTTSVNVLDRHDYIDRLFRATWRRLGGKFSGGVLEAPAPVAGLVAAGATPDSGIEAGSRLLTDHVSRALPELMRDQNKNSDNTLARLLYLSLGSLEADAWFGSRPLALTPPLGTASATPSTSPALTSAARAAFVVQAWFRQRGLDASGLVIDNGSGLSRSERIRPSQMAAVLRAASQSQWAPEFLASLPIAGLDGTMRRRLRTGPATARARIKTGTLKDVVAIAGFVPDANNQPCLVVGMINSEQAGRGAGRAVLDALIDWVATTR
jgi:D-alanyl-D-alanine carboxypeptidase/D-alanyl-D-alanine-endopeptidase (penicillin-binding protein 4)